MNSQDLQLIINDEIADIIVQRGIKENEIKDVIYYALNGGTYLHTSNSERFLAKKRIDKFTAYVEYAPDNNVYKVVNVYSHRVSLTEDQ